MMKRLQLPLLLCLFAIAALGASYATRMQSGANMTAAGARFVKTLSDDQRAKAVLDYDTPPRTDWHYIPKPERKGLQIKEMNEAQRDAAHGLLQSA